MSLPQSKTWLVDGFCRFTTRMVRRNFQCFAVQGLDQIPSIAASNCSLVIYANHIGWWDPIVAMLLRKKYLPDRVFYAPIDAKALEAYGVFRQLGFYGLKLETFAGASEFLKTSREILSDPKSSVWITPEGVFCDCRDLEQPFMPGLAHLAATTPNTIFVPLAIEYPFWQEPKPMIATRFGEPLSFQAGASKADCGKKIFESLRDTQRHLASSVMRRDFSEFDFVVAPKSQRLGLYDNLRAWKAWLQGRPFDPSHASINGKNSTSPGQRN